MRKTFDKNGCKKFLYYFSCVFLLTGAIYISGCTGAKPEDPALVRARDSISIYTDIANAFTHYQSSLIYTSEENHNKAKSSFEDALKDLKKAEEKFSKDSTYIVWKKDCDNLMVSVIQDYLYTQKDISESSAVFSLAKQYGVDYEKISLNADQESDTEPLPDGSDVPLEKNSAVDEYIEFFSNTDRGKNFIDKTTYRSGKYFPLMRKILRYHNTPEEMIYLSVQESGLNPTIVSKAGAVGLWQFMPSTGRAYGLYQDGFRDDRRDFEKATDAAARHLKDLYRSFGDWYLAWAAYNAGPGRVTSAISKSGSRNYWELRNYLPGETKNYVPSILALSFIYRNPEGYGFKDLEYGKPISFDRINIDGEITLDKVAEYSETDVETIRELNSELTSDAVPDYEVPYQLRIPHGSYKTFIKNYKKSAEYKSSAPEPEFAGDETSSYYSTIVSVETYEVRNYNPGDEINLGNTSDKIRIPYFFKGTETLQKVADSFKVRESDIRRWNYLSYATYPKPNSEISVYLTTKQFNTLYNIKEETQESDTTGAKEENGKINYGKKINSNETEVQKNNGSTEKKNGKENNKQAPKEKQQSYTVKEGDYLGDIAERYGVSVADLRSWNNIEGDKILVGQKLKIYSDKKETETKSKSSTYHIVEEGEFLSEIAKEYGVKIGDLMKWNSLEDDKIYAGQKLLISEPKTTKEKSTNTGKTKTHKVKEGENLTAIADKYEVSVKDIMLWNSLEDDVIVPGQELTVSKPATKNGKESTKNKTYKVKKGDTLASISEEFNVSMANLKKWNDLESDGTVYAGQVLKLYGDESKQKEKTDQNTSTKKKKDRKKKNNN